jgi:ATP-dependent helicase YprA (DUF1998 family)
MYKAFCMAGLVGDFPLYQHQIDMIKNYAIGKNCIITTGTGSGKTESFLLPLFAYLTKQISIWKQTPEKESKFNWFIDSTRHTKNGTAHYTAVPQRENSTRKASIKAIILYPMNALVDDQMTRLRKALDSKEAESFYSEFCEKHRIYFGQYNGATPISSEINSQEKHNELREKLNELLLYWNKIKEVITSGNLSQDEIEDILDTMADETVVYDDTNYFYHMFPLKNLTLFMNLLYNRGSSVVGNPEIHSGFRSDLLIYAFKIRLHIYIYQKL